MRRWAPIAFVLTSAVLTTEALAQTQVGSVVVVPEPAAMALLATGLVGLAAAGFLRRRPPRN